MSSDIVTTVSAYGDSIEIRTPKDEVDAQHQHTLKFFAAYNELRRREADRQYNDWSRQQFAPVAMHSRENPAGLFTGSDYKGDKRMWRPVLPLATWSAPKPLSDRDALKRARQLHGKEQSVRGEFVGQISFDEV
jgi:hypothetical protein